MCTFEIFDRHKVKAKIVKKELKSIGGKYCILHHGLGVQTHECGAVLCRECMWNTDRCAVCNAPLSPTTKEQAQAPPSPELSSKKVETEEPEPSAERRPRYLQREVASSGELDEKEMLVGRRERKKRDYETL